MRFKSVTAKLGNMRKPAEFTVCPKPSNAPEGFNEVTIQSDKRICRFDPTTRKGVLSSGKGGHPGFIMLSSFMGATEIEVPQEVVDACLENEPKKGDVLFGGILTIG